MEQQISIGGGTNSTRVTTNPTNTCHTPNTHKLINSHANPMSDKKKLPLSNEAASDLRSNFPKISWLGNSVDSVAESGGWIRIREPERLGL